MASFAPVSYSVSPTYPTPIKHVVIILLENQEYSSVIGSSNAPYENALAKNYSLAAQYYAVGHPSLPNYLAIVGGSTFGVSSDCLPDACTQNSTNITDLLVQHGYSWKEYAESMHENCSEVNGPDGLYAPKHVPFVYYSDVTGNNGTGNTSSYCASHVVPYSQFANDLQNGNLPNYAFITPNLCDDGHDCSLSVADRWLSSNVPQIIGSSSFSSSVIFIVYDEGTTDSGFGSFDGGRVVCLVVSPFAKEGYASQNEYSHYSLLATVESIFGLGNLGRNDSSSAIMQDMFSIALPSNGVSQSTVSTFSRQLTNTRQNEYILGSIASIAMVTILAYAVTKLRKTKND